MINVSQTIKNSCKADKNTHTEYIIINNQTIYIKGKLNATAYKDTTFFGTFNMKVLEFETENTTQFRNREFEYYKVIDGNAFKVGTFITTEVVDNDSDENIKVTANDYALKFAVPYTSELDYGSGEITLYDVLEECCNQVGVELENKFIDNNSFKVDSNQFVNGELVGDVICAIAGISGNFATITNEDKLRLTFTNGTGAEQTATIDGTTKINASELKSIELLPKTTQETTTGKNKCPNNLTSGTASGITYTKNNDGSIKITGTASARVEPDLYNNSSNPIVFPAGTYKNTSNRMIILFTGGYNVLYANSTLTLNSSISVTRIYFRIENGESNLNETFYPQIIVNGQSETYEPYTGGIASPNPNYPQNIETITGENTIKVVGKNLLPISTLSNTTTNGITFTNNNDGSYTLNGTATGYTAFNLFTNLSFNGNYTYVLKDTATSGFALYIQSSSAGVGSTTTHTTINNNVAKLIIGIQQGTALSNLTIKPYVYSGNYDSTIEYEPYQEKVAKLNLGKNLINPYSTNIGTSNGITTTYNEDQSLSFSGTITSTWAYLTNQYSSGKINLNIPSGDYTFSIDKASSDYTTIIRLFYDSSNYQDITINKNTTSRTASVSNNTIAYQIYIGGLTSGTELNETLHFQLEKGSTATDYSPYFTPIELCKIGDYQDRLFKASGKNLFENIDMENAYITSTGEYQASTSNALYPYTKVKGGEKIILSTQIAVRGLSINEYNSAKTFIKRTQVNTGSNNTTINTITLDNNASYIRIVINYDNTSNFNQDTIDTLLVQLEYGNSRSEYEPYGNYWYKYNAIGKVVLDGSESGWALFFSTNGVFVNNNVVSSISNATGINCISNYFSNTYSRSYIRSNLDSVDNVCATNLAELILANKSISSVNDFKTWLSTHNTIVYYILATPTTTQITDDDLITQLEALIGATTYLGQTNIITSGTDLNPLLDVTTYAVDDPSFIITNSGNFKSKPIITIYGLGTIGLYLNGIQVLSLDMGETTSQITIDVAKLEAYNQETGALMNRSVTGDYNNLSLNVGENTITESGTLQGIEIENYSRWL